MGVPEEGAWLGAVQEVLSRSHLWRPEDVAANLAQAVSGPGLRSRIWLTDYEQWSLRAVPQPGADVPEPLPIGASAAGRAYALVRPLLAGGDGVSRWWAPMVTAPTG
jgi:hypothetical protein